MAMNCARFGAIADLTTKYFFCKRFFLNYIVKQLNIRELLVLLPLTMEKIETVIMITRNKMNRNYVKHLLQWSSLYLFIHCTFMAPRILIFVNLPFFILLQRTVRSTVSEFLKLFFLSTRLFSPRVSHQMPFMIYNLFNFNQD